jgi:hypothetical protein
MHRIIISLFLILISVLLSHAQDAGNLSSGKNGVYAEMVLVRHDFSEGFVSLNYERMIGKKGRSALRAGIYPDFESTISFPVAYHWISSPNKNHHFEWGFGAVFRVEHYKNPYDPYQTKEWFYDVPAIMIPIMYRFQKSKGLILRGGINLFLSWPVLPSPSISIGYRF